MFVRASVLWSDVVVWCLVRVSHTGGHIGARSERQLHTQTGTMRRMLGRKDESRTFTSSMPILQRCTNVCGR